MTPQQCKELLDAGILQAYAEGKTIEVKIPDEESRWISVNNLIFNDLPCNYRIKLEPKPHTFETAIKAIAKHGTTIKNNCDTFVITEIYQDFVALATGCPERCSTFDFKRISLWSFPDGTPFHQGDS